jgi:hypothetical protein
VRSLARPRVPAAESGAALYESHYLTANDPAGGRALWLRYTALKRRGEPARPTVWLTWFDRSAARPHAIRVTAQEPLGDPGPAWSRSSLGELSPAGASGTIEGVSWSLEWEPRAPELPYLPAGWLYDRPIPRSNGAALIPLATVRGTLELAGAGTLNIDGWDGMLGHNWGSEHADHWTWIHAGGLGEDRSGWVDLALVRVGLGPLLTPWLAGGAVRLGGHTHRAARRGGVRHELHGETASIAVPLAGRARLELELTAPETATVSWDYASPRGPGRRVRNCSVADGRLTLRSDSGPRTLELEGRVAVEHGAPADP